MTTRSRIDDSRESIAIRKLLKTLPVQVGVPSWMVPRVKEAIRAGRLPKRTGSLRNPLHALEHACGHVGGVWCDHFGWGDLDDVEVFVSEPYTGGIHEMWRQVEAFAAALELDFKVSPNSWHYPGHTISIIFSPRS